MLTNQDRRAILEQVKTSGSGDIIAALQGQLILPQQEEQQIPTPQPVELPPTPPPPVQNVSMDSIPSTTSSLVDSSSNTSLQIQDLPTGSAEPQLLQTGGLKKYSPGGLYTAEASSTAVAPVNIPTIIKPKTQEEEIEEMIANSLNKPKSTIYDPYIGNNPNKQWISGASNKMYASGEAKQRSQDYGEAVLGFAAPIPFLNSMKVSASGAKIPGLIDDVVLGPLGKAYGKAKGLFKPKNPLSTDLSNARFPKYDDKSLIHTTPVEELAARPLNPGKFSKADVERIFKAKQKHIKYLQSDEYASKRMANTGESLSAVKADVDLYVKEVNEAPLNMEFFDNEIANMRMQGAYGEYYGAPSGKVGRMYVRRGYGVNLSDETVDVIKHEIGHAGSPAGKMKVANPDAPKNLQYDKGVENEIYKNYPVLKIKKEIRGGYMRDPAEQQVRLVRTGEWLKENVKWDGKLNTLTDDMINTLIDKVSKSEVPHDIEMLIRFADATPKQMKNSIGKAWALAPVAVGAGTATSEKKQEGGLRDHMMEYMNYSGRDTNNVNLVMNAIAEHESKSKFDEIQVSQKDDGTFFDGPGRGLFQFEVGPKKGGNTALNRTANFLKSNTDKTIKDFPNVYDRYISSNSQDFSTFSKEDQEGIFIGDKIFGGPERRNEFNKVVKRDTPPTQEEVFMYWLNNHKGKVNGKTIKNLTKEEINVERKKWNERTKNMFKTGGKKKGADGRACWDGYRYAGTENGKDKCVPFEYGGFKKKCKYGCW